MLCIVSIKLCHRLDTRPSFGFVTLRGAIATLLQNEDGRCSASYRASVKMLRISSSESGAHA